MIAEIFLVGLIVFLIAMCFGSINIIDQTQRGLVMRFGKFNRYAEPGINFVIPLVEEIWAVSITEEMIDAEQQEIITKDKLNALVDAQVYFKVKDEKEAVKASMFNVSNYKRQIVSLARTTLRNIIGTMTLEQANSDRDKINTMLLKTLSVETKNWGLEIVRTELKEIQPPEDVQVSMNNVVKAENQKVAAKDLALAAQTEADGKRMAAIKEAEGDKDSKILRAKGEAEAIKIVNEAATKYFKGNAQLLKKLQTTENALKENTKYIVSSDTKLVNLLGDIMGGK